MNCGFLFVFFLYESSMNLLIQNKMGVTEEKFILKISYNFSPTEHTHKITNDVELLIIIHNDDVPLIKMIMKSEYI